MNAKTEFRTTRPWTGLVDGLPVLENRRLEHMNNIVLADFGTPWDYEPRGPFQFQMYHQSADPLRSSWLVSATLAEAVNDFARWALPPREGWMATIVDESFRRVLSATWVTVPPDGGGPTGWEIGGGWFGCKAAFDEMRRQCVCDEVSIAMWEVTAMRTAPGSGYVE